VAAVSPGSLVAGAREVSTLSLSRSTASLSEISSCNVCMDVSNLHLVSLEDVRRGQFHENTDKATLFQFGQPAQPHRIHFCLAPAGPLRPGVNLDRMDCRSGLCGTLLCIYNGVDLIRSAHKCKLEKKVKDKIVVQSEVR